MEIKTILVPLDFSEPSLHALAYARELAARFGASLHLLHVLPNPEAPATFNPYGPEAPAAFVLTPEAVEALMKRADEELERALPAADREAFRARTFVVAGDPRQEILDHAASEAIGLIVMGTHGRTGAARLLMGSVAERVVRAATCPVLTVR